MIDATPMLRAYAHHRLGRLDAREPANVQRRQLLKLVRIARHTRFGRDHGFDAIGTVEDFQQRVPLRRFEDFWETYWKPDFPVVRNASWPGTIPYFAKTSGTSSGTSKHIPVTKGTMAGNRRGVLDMLAFHKARNPESHVLGGKNFMLGGSTELDEIAPGIFAGDMSGIAAREVPLWAKPMYFPRGDLATIGDWERKIEMLGRLSLEEDVRTIGGTSSWLLLFLQGLMRERGGGLLDCYPNLELIVYGGVNFEPYRAQYEDLVAGTGIDLREVYPASEGFIAAADRGVGEGLRLQTDGGLFYEFVPIDELDSDTPTRHWIGTAETGVNYALVLSSSAGMWSYVIGDTVRFVDLDPPRILVTGRTSTSLSAFGEHLIEEEIQRGVTRAAEAIGAAVTDFSVAPVYPAGDEQRGHHLFVVEFAGAVPDPGEVAEFARTLDAALSDINEDYAAHREGELQMKRPEVVAAKSGTFSDWMKARGRLGGQNKVPRVITDPDMLRSLRETARADPVAGDEA